MKDRRRHTLFSVSLMVPAVVICAVFIVFPLVETIRISFSKWDGLGPLNWVGLANYRRLFGDSLFRVGIVNNLIFAVLVTSGTVALGLLMALAIDRRVPLWRVYKFVFFLPVVLPMTSVAIMWSNTLDPNTGIASRLGGHLWGVLSTGVLADPHLAIYAICFVAIWQFAGLPMILFLGGLQNIPLQVQEAATIDGVGPISRAARISIPMCKDVVATVLLLQLIFSFKVFDIVQAMTGGGPGNSTQVLGTAIYRTAFTVSKFGYASAMAVVTSLIIIVISSAYLYFLKPARIERHG